MAILGICNTNGFKNPCNPDTHDEFNCLAINVSRFNHSCSPNAAVRITSDGEFFIRTITKIKTGEEISFCSGADNFFMKNVQTRQKFLKENYNFICVCNHCKDGKEDIEAFEAFEKFNKDAKRLRARRVDEQRPMYQKEIFPFVKKEIQCYKDMYNLGKKKKSAVTLLYHGVYLTWKIINYHFR